MEKRMNYYDHIPEALKLMISMEEYIRASSIDYALIELIKIRASQINGCAYCLNMHTRDARKNGETEQRIYCISAWRDSDFYSDKERLALELTEKVTNISTNHIEDEFYERVLEHFSEKEFVDLLLIINQINSWNRLSIATGNIATNKK